MKKIKILLAVALGAFLTGCYNDFDTPAVKVWQEEEVEAMGLTRISIAEVKEKFNEVYGGLSRTGVNKSWSDTKSIKFGTAYPGEDKFKSEGTYFWEESANYYIKAKVISSDEEGNIYKSLYIWDDGEWAGKPGAAIELRLCGTLYTTYQLNLDTKESTWVYVLLKDLYLGNYRMMLSIGDAPTCSYNVVKELKYYGNSNIELPQKVSEHVLPGDRCMLEADDILTVDASNYLEKLGTPATIEAALGRLVQFKGIKVRYAGVKNQDGVTNPALKSGSYDNIYPSWLCTDVRPTVSQPWYYWAYSVDNDKLYGSVLITYAAAPTITSERGVYSVRTSGYSRFGMKPAPKDGAEGDVLGIFAIYAQQSDFSGTANDYGQYQITVSRHKDLGFTDLLDPAWIEANTPAESYNPPVADDTAEGDFD